MRLGFVLGFLIGGGVASFISRPREEREHALNEVSLTANDAADATASQVQPYVDRIREQIDEARDAAREAQLEKEAELERMYEEMVRPKDDPRQ